MNREESNVRARIFVAGVCQLAALRLLNTDIIAPMTNAMPVARDVLYLLVNVVPSVLIVWAFCAGFLAMWSHAINLVATGCVAVGGLCVWLATSQLAPAQAALCVGYALCLLGRSWVSVLFVVALCEVVRLHESVLLICSFYVVGSACQYFVVLAPAAVRLALFVALCIAELACISPLARGNLTRAAEAGSIDDLQVSNPFSFTEFFNPAFVALFVFHAVFGFALALNCISGVPVDTSFAGAAASAVLLCCFVALKSSEGRLDVLSILAALLVVAGLLLAIVGLSQPLGAAPNMVLGVANVFFSLIGYLVLVSMGSRSKIGAVIVVAYGSIYESLGTLFGSMAGHMVNSFSSANDASALLALAGGLFAFVVLLCVWLRSFSFDAIVQEIKPIVVVEAPQVATVPERGERLETCCKQLGQAAGLTKREQEIFVLLARGRTGKAISEQLVLSYNTVKTHVKHVYMKLEVHSQQELIDVVEDELGESA